MPNDTLPLKIQAALDMIQQYQRPMSGTNTPLLSSIPKRWFSDRPSLQLYDGEIINVFLNLATKHLNQTFGIFNDLRISAHTQPALYLAAAAVGGLYCNVRGSYKIAKSMFHDSRRLVGELVSQLFVLSLKTADCVDQAIQ